MTTIDGPLLAQAIAAGSQWVAAQRVHLNDINVFPVPDGDTGTNLTLTLKAATEAVTEVQDRPLGEVASALSRSVLLGARGNAGIIFAQFLRGFASEIGGVDLLYASAFSRAFSAAVDTAYEALAQPVEGTILTVLRDAADEGARVVGAGETDFVRILSAMREAARRSLSTTPELLPVLHEAGVVDAGGEGFVDFLDGVARLVAGEDVGDALGAIPRPRVDALPRLKERDLKYRYCTEFIVEGPRANPGDLKVRLVGLGGSLVVVGGDGIARVHVHTNEPALAMRMAGEFGKLKGEKIDDMREQHREFIRAHAGQEKGSVGGGATTHGRHATGDRQGGRYAGERLGRHVRIVTDSTSDLPENVVDELGVTVVPLSVCFGYDTYRDGVELTRQGFYTRLAECDELPTTTQPTPEDFLSVYGTLSWETKAALSIHLSSEMSGTVASAIAAADRVSGLEVEVVDSKLVSVSLGLVVIELARAARRGASLSELVAMAEDLCRRARVYFTVGTFDYLVKGGRIGRAQAVAGKVTGLKPILTVEDGTVTSAGRALGDHGVMHRIVDLAAAEIDGGSGGTLGVVHAGRPEIVDRIRESFFTRFGFEEVRVFELGCIVGAHAGPGTWGVSYFRSE